MASRTPAIRWRAPLRWRERLDAEGVAAEITRDHAIAYGLMVRAVGNSLVMAPPLIIAGDKIDLLVSRLRRALDLTAVHNGISSRA